MRPRRMFRLTLPAVLIAAAIALPAGASASGGVVPSGPDPTESSIFVQQAQQDPPTSPSASDGFEWADAGIGAALVLGLLGVTGATLLLGTRMHRRTA
jgi:hypothetical protein